MSQPALKSAPRGGWVQAGLDERLAIAGSGTIGCGLAVTAAAADIPVLLWARSQKSEATAVERIAAECARLDAKKAADQVRLTTDFSELGSATLAVEAVSEAEDVK